MKPFPFMFHGGDYNPDQWLHIPGTVDEDFRLFKLAGLNSASIGIFAWSALEPEEGVFDFSFIDDIMERATRAKMAIILATPSAAKPNWMAQKYPEIRRMHSPGRQVEPQRQEQCHRHNHCPTSPVYREKCRIINTKLAERYGKHPSLAMWHVSNEYNAGCECPLCNAAFRRWLKKKYRTLQALNEAWWTGFWAHRFTDWEQVRMTDPSIPAMVVDRQRFDSDQMLDFFRAESAPLRKITPDIPITANMMGTFLPLDYWRWAKHMDVASWDAYPPYHDRPDTATHTAAHTSFTHDLNRSLKGGKPFLLMESSPGPTNWMPINRLLRPGQHRMKSLQAVAHGSDGVCYFQLRKGRGGCEKFHGAVIDHVGSEDNRMFQEVASLGKDLKRLAPVVGARTPAKVAIVFDWESRWMLNASNGPSAFAKDTDAAALAHYRAYWKRGIPVDLVNGDARLDGYDVVIAPQLYMLREGFASRVERFVSKGGAFVATYLTGIVNETDLVFTGGLPGPLRNVLGIRSMEIDYLYDDERNEVIVSPDAPMPLSGTHAVARVCDVIRAETAQVVATYGRDFYAGEPAVTVNRFGKGEAWYIAAAGADDSLLDAFHGALAQARKLKRALPDCDLPAGVTAQIRKSKTGSFIFVINFNNAPAAITLTKARRDLLTGRTLSGAKTLPPYGVLVLQD
ncbi:MAG: beta-galactosidase [Kiritimatiellia bacterium]|jgi:beta-galactosidase